MHQHVNAGQLLQDLEHARYHHRLMSGECVAVGYTYCALIKRCVPVHMSTCVCLYRL